MEIPMARTPKNINSEVGVLTREAHQTEVIAKKTIKQILQPIEVIPDQSLTRW